MDPITIPEDITPLSDTELADLLTAALETFDSRSRASQITQDDLTELRALSAGVERIRAEQAERITAAEAAADEIAQLAAQVRGDDPATATADGGDAPADSTAPEGGDAPAADPAPEAGAAAPEATASAAVTARPALDLSRVRSRTPSVLPAPPPPGTRITAAVDVPGYTPGAPLDFNQVTSGIISRAGALKTAGGGVGQVISYHHPYPDELVVTDSSSAPEGSTVAMRAADQSRLPARAGRAEGGSLVASGGWCAPSETLYDITGESCPDMLWDAPEIQLSRGGLRYFKPLTLDVSQMTWVHTEADDIAGNEKPCFKIPCPQPTEVRCDAVGVCLESGILTQRFFPELVSWYLRHAMVAQEIRVRSELFTQALATATPVTIPGSFGAISAIYAAVALQAADMIERHALCDGTALEVVFPWWSRNLFLADLARRNGVGLDEVSIADVQAVYSALGVRVQWARSLGPAVPDQIGGATPATAWPEEISFLIYPAGGLVIGRGEEINLGVVHDSAKFLTNDHTALFAEECVALVDRSVDTRLVTVPVCPSGEVGARTELTCPAA